MKRLAVLGVLVLVPLLAGGCGGSKRAAGCSVTLRAVAPKGQGVSPAGMQTAQQIIESRLAKIGVSSPQVSVHGDEIVIDFSGVPDPALAAKITLETGRLQVFDFEPSLAPPSVTRN